MKTYRVLLTCLVLGGVLAGPAQAQGPARWGMRHQQADQAGKCDLGAPSGQAGFLGGGPGALGEALGLTEAQKAQLASLREKNKDQMRQTMQDLRAQVQSGALTRDQARQEMEKIRQQRRQELAAILTPEQLQKLDELKAARGPGKGNGQPGFGKGMGGAARAAALGEALGLTEAQKAQLASLREKNKDQMRQAMQDLRAQVQSGALTRDQARQEMEKFRQQRRQEFEAILTPEQLQKLQELKAKWPRREAAPAAKAAAQKEESWGSIKSQAK